MIHMTTRFNVNIRSLSFVVFHVLTLFMLCSLIILSVFCLH